LVHVLLTEREDDVEEFERIVTHPPWMIVDTLPSGHDKSRNRLVCDQV
jgi:hypothetical protein